MGTDGDPVAGVLEHAYRDEWSAVVATLARRLGDLQAAEDAAAEAFAAAARVWARDGAPPNPGGWLMTTAWRKAVDQLRGNRAVAVDPQQFPEVGAETGGGVTSGGEVTSVGGDDRLGLVFACCHPALALEVRVALMLRYVAGLTTRQIAAAFVLPEATLAQRRRTASRRPTGRRSRRCMARWPGFPRRPSWRSTGPWRSAWPTARTPGWRSWNRSWPPAR